MHVTLDMLRKAKTRRFVYRSAFFQEGDLIDLFDLWTIETINTYDRIDDLKALGAVGERVCKVFIDLILKDPEFQHSVHSDDLRTCSAMRVAIHDWNFGAPRTEELRDRMRRTYTTTRAYLDTCSSRTRTEYHAMFAHVLAFLTTSSDPDVFYQTAQFADAVELARFDCRLLLTKAIDEVESNAAKESLPR